MTPDFSMEGVRKTIPGTDSEDTILTMILLYHKEQLQQGEAHAPEAKELYKT
jgi:hypothetical protein